jgi:hypothetical protein
MPRRFEPPGASANRIFAKRAGAFAKRAHGWPAWPTLEVASALALVLAVIAGPFGTDAIDPLRRTLFWAILLGANLAGWRLLINRLVRAPADWPRVAAIGAVLFGLPLPLEIRAVLRLVGVAGAVESAWHIWIAAAAITGLIFVATRLWGRPLPRAAPDPAETDTLLMRWSVVPERLAAVLAEDHYCRLVLTDGSEKLVHGRFGETVAALTALPGLQVHRGAWVAQSAVCGAVRQGRGWRLRLVDGRLVKVSARHRGEALRRGLLRRDLSPHFPDEQPRTIR